MSSLKRFFDEYKSDEGRATYKHKHYQRIYEEHLSRFIDEPVTLVELGIGYGGSLQMWRSFLGSKCSIIGIDKHGQLCFEDNQIHCIASDECNISSLGLKDIDIFIDDGSHICSNQINTLNSMFPMIKPGGVYIVEDTHTSYREDYGGGYNKPGTLIQYCKSLIESLHHQEDERIEFPSFIQSIDSIQFYRTMVIIRKCEAPT